MTQSWSEVGATTWAGPIWAIWFYSASPCEWTLGLQQCLQVSKWQPFQKQLFQDNRDTSVASDSYFTESFTHSQFSLVRFFCTFFFWNFHSHKWNINEGLLCILLWTPWRPALSHCLHSLQTLGYNYMKLKSII